MISKPGEEPMENKNQEFTIDDSIIDMYKLLSQKMDIIIKRNQERKKKTQEK